MPVKPFDTFNSISSDVLAVGLGASMVSMGWSKLIGISWFASMVIVFLTVVFWLLVNEIRGAAGVAGWFRSRSVLLGISLFFLIMVLRMYPLIGVWAPPGGDMSMHMLLARIASENTILPNTQIPLYPDVPYGIYPLGFHGLVALIAGNVDRLLLASLIVISLAQTLFALAIHRVICARSGASIALITTLVAVFVQRNPQNYISWGGNPCVFGFALAILAWQSAKECFNFPTRTRFAMTVILIAATAYTHPTAALALGFALVITVMIRLFNTDRIQIMQLSILLAICSLFFALPLIFELAKSDFSSAEQMWVRQNHLNPPQSPSLSLILLPDYWKYIFGDATLMFGGMGLVAGLIQRRWRQCLALVLVLTLVPFVVIWYRHSGFPLSLAIYPERVMLILAIPWAILFSFLIEGIGKLWKFEPQKNRLPKRAAAGLMSIVLLVTAIVNYNQYYVDSIDSSQIVTELDVSAFDEICATATPATLVSNREGDAAEFLPGLWGVATTNVQWNPVWKEELDFCLSNRVPNLLFTSTAIGGDPSNAIEIPQTITLFKQFCAEQETVSIWNLLEEDIE